MKVYLTYREERVFTVDYDNNPSKYIIINFDGDEEYRIRKFNLYNETLQVVLINDDPDGSKEYVAFIDIKQKKDVTKVILIGQQHFSDIRLRDNDTVIAVMVNDNKIYRSYISKDDSKVDWKLVPYNINEKISSININKHSVPGYQISVNSDPVYVFVPSLENREIVIQECPSTESELTTVSTTMRSAEENTCFPFSFSILFGIPLMTSALSIVIAIYYAIKYYRISLSLNRNRKPKSLCEENDYSHEL